ncbi:MAG: hypothetical protein ACREX0_02785, partial [Noviherbaspirillum sp.]
MGLKDEQIVEHLFAGCSFPQNRCRPRNVSRDTGLSHFAVLQRRQTLAHPLQESGVNLADYNA